jgi:Zn-finger nucleic acid-binding protein
MKCPICPDATLLMTDRQGVEIDYCPQCRGLWLDRGELDKLLELASKSPPSANDRPSQHDFVDSDHQRMRGNHYQRKKSWWSEILD